MDIYDFLALHNISYQRFDHPAVFTCAQSKELAPEMPGAEAKSLFLRDKKKQLLIMLVAAFDKSVDLKAFSDQQALPRLSFGSAEQLMEVLGVEPGSVSLLALINDPQIRVKVYIDEDAWKADALCCHPLVNTATLSIPMSDIKRFLEITKHEFEIVKIPVKPVNLEIESSEK